MARTGREIAAPTALVPLLLRFARMRGVWVPELAGRFGFATDAADQPEGITTPAALRDLFEAVADATFEPFLGLRLAEMATAPRFSGALRQARSLEEGLLAASAHASDVHPHLSFSLVRSPEGALWTQTTALGPPGVGPYADDFALGLVLSRCREACRDAPIRPVRVQLSHARPRDKGPLHLFFGTQAIDFGAESSGFVLPGEALASRVAPGAPPEGPLAPQGMAALVASRLPELLPDDATLDDTARALAVSSRTLQRRLEEEGTTFLEVLDRVREAEARTRLREGDAPLIDIAERLGFSDLASFSRAFKRWTGQPPGTYRRAARLDDLQKPREPGTVEG